MFAALAWVAHDHRVETPLPKVGPPRATPPPRIVGGLIPGGAGEVGRLTMEPACDSHAMGASDTIGPRRPLTTESGRLGDEPAEWLLTPVTEVDAVPAAIRADLEPHDAPCLRLRLVTAHSLLTASSNGRVRRMS